MYNIWQLIAVSLAVGTIGFIFGRWPLPPRRPRGLDRWQAPRKQPEPQVGNWDAVRDAANRGNMRPLAELEMDGARDMGDRT